MCCVYLRSHVSNKCWISKWRRISGSIRRLGRGPMSQTVISVHRGGPTLQCTIMKNRSAFSMDTQFWLKSLWIRSGQHLALLHLLSNQRWEHKEKARKWDSCYGQASSTALNHRIWCKLWWLLKNSGTSSSRNTYCDWDAYTSQVIQVKLPYSMS